MGGCAFGWVAASGSFREWGGCFRACGRWPGCFCSCSIRFSPLYRPDLAKFEYEPTHLFVAGRTAELP